MRPETLRAGLRVHGAVGPSADIDKNQQYPEDSKILSIPLKPRIVPLGSTPPNLPTRVCYDAGSFYINQLSCNQLGKSLGSESTGCSPTKVVVRGPRDSRQTSRCTCLAAEPSRFFVRPMAVYETSRTVMF